MPLAYAKDREHVANRDRSMQKDPCFLARSKDEFQAVIEEAFARVTVKYERRPYSFRKHFKKILLYPPWDLFFVYTKPKRIFKHMFLLRF